MLIQVDHREHDLIRCIQGLIQTLPIYKDLAIEITNLPLGDVILSVDGKEKWIVERKSLQDLAASIKDGRYEEQSFRLQGSDIPNHNIVYLIEGDINQSGGANNRFREKVDKLTLYSAMFSLNYYKGFSVFRTFSIEESALFLCNSANKMRREGSKPGFYDQIVPLKVAEENIVIETQSDDVETTIEKETKDYIQVVKRVKKENVTAQNINEIMLCQIPGISSVTALAIVEQVGPLSAIIERGKTDPASLFQIQYKTEKGQLRKVSKACVQNVLDYLVNK
jgi:hypothetical protein